MKKKGDFSIPHRTKEREGKEGERERDRERKREKEREEEERLFKEERGSGEKKER
jgi:hypothetical protein